MFLKCFVLHLFLKGFENCKYDNATCYFVFEYLNLTFYRNILQIKITKRNLKKSLSLLKTASLFMTLMVWLHYLLCKCALITKFSTSFSYSYFIPHQN